MLVFAFGSIRAPTYRHEESAELTARSFWGGTRSIFVERGIVDIAFAENALLRGHCRVRLERHMAALIDGAGFSDQAIGHR